MKKITMVAVLVMIAFLFAGNLRAQAAKEEKSIVFVDISRIFDSHKKTKEYDTTLEAKYNEYEKERNAKLEKIRESEGKLSLLKEPEREKLQAEIDKDKTALLEYDRQVQTDLRKERDERIREILAEIEKAISSFAEKEGYPLILNDRVLIYGNETLDITDKVIEVINK